VSAAVQAMRALLECGSVAAAVGRLRDAKAEEAARLLAAHPDADRLLSAQLDHSSVSDARSLARAFDRLVAISPEGSVALYSLGDPAILAAATDEVLGLLRTWQILGPARRVLELGCGIGRFLPGTGAIGHDVSWGMLAEARRRLPGAALVQGSGCEIPVADRSLDVILAVDTFPYIVQAGLAETHLAEAARVLRAGGEIAIFNYAYGSEDELPALAARNRFRITVAGVRPFHVWDASAWRLEVILS
jgi:SAM-dependent methyltransferase